MSELNTSFTFRLTHADKAALAELAARMGCDRGAALRQIIRRSTTGLDCEGDFVTRDARYRVKLASQGGEA